LECFYFIYKNQLNSTTQSMNEVSTPVELAEYVVNVNDDDGDDNDIE